MHTRNRSSGFTLIELLIVIAIIGILAAVMLPSLLGVRNKSNDAAALAAARNVINAMAAIEVGNLAGANIASCTLGTAEVSFTLNPATATTTTKSTNIPKSATAITCTSTASQYRVHLTYSGGNSPSIDLDAIK